MKPIQFLLFACIGLQPVFGQLNNTRWDGSIRGDNPRAVVLDFGRDSLVVYAAGSNEVIEAMTYSSDGQHFTLNKVYGQSDCDTTPGEYAFKIKGDELSIDLVNDPCGDRSGAINSTKWKRAKKKKTT